MLPVIALVGRPNVGKSTLFNRLTRSQQALVLDEPGVTRDRQYGQGQWEEKPFIVIDTAGWMGQPQDEIEKAAKQQSWQAILEADVVFFVVDARLGLTDLDRELARKLRKQNVQVFLIVNKVDGLDISTATVEFCGLGFQQVYPVAATQNWGIDSLLTQTLPQITVTEKTLSLPTFEEEKPIIAIVGRPNVGKSTLLNTMLGEDRVIVCDMPGTTRDSIAICMQRRGKDYTLIDTAGMRKKKNVSELIEKFSIVKTLQAIKNANIVIVVFDARLGLTDQDLSLIDFTIEAGRSLIICANKWDGMNAEDREQVKKQLSYRLKFVHFAPIHCISALHGTGVGDLFPLIDKIYASNSKQFSPTQLTELLNKAVDAHALPLVKGRRIKLRYAHCGGHHPFTIIIHGNQTDALPLTYQRYLSNFYIKALRLVGSPVKIVFKTGDNPFKDKPNILTRRQIYKKRRLMKHVKALAKRK